MWQQLFREPMTFQTLLWVGVVAFSLGLTFLVYTRWGQYRIVGKCIFFSLMAHGLLVLYGFSTQLDGPSNDPEGTDNSLVLENLEVDIGGQEPGKSQEPVAPWDQALSPAAAPEPEPAAAPELVASAIAREDPEMGELAPTVEEPAMKLVSAETDRSPFRQPVVPLPAPDVRLPTPESPDRRKATTVGNIAPSERPLTPSPLSPSNRSLTRQSFTSPPTLPTRVARPDPNLVPRSRPAPAPLRSPAPSQGRPRIAKLNIEPEAGPRQASPLRPAPTREPRNPLVRSTAPSTPTPLRRTSEVPRRNQPLVGLPTQPGRTVGPTRTEPVVRRPPGSSIARRSTPATELPERKDPLSPIATPIAQTPPPERTMRGGPTRVTPTFRPTLVNNRPRRATAPPPTPAVYEARTAPNRTEIAIERGASPKSEQAVSDALAWLAAHQSSDGRWDGDGFVKTCPAGSECDGKAVQDKEDCAVTGLVLLAFFGTGNTHLEGEYRMEVTRGLNWLLAQQTSNGALRGEGKMYSHAIATLALTEAYAMTKEPLLREPVEKAIGYTIQSQNPETGGWRYFPGQYGDTSIYGWQIMSLRSAEIAGISIPPETWERSQKWLALVSSGRSGGLACYVPGQDPTMAMTAEALLCRILLGMETTHPAAQEAGTQMLRHLPTSGEQRLYYWYYGTLSAHQMGGTYWERWNQSLRDLLIAMQRKKGHAAGSWEPLGVWGSEGGRIYSTAMGTLCLESYYRFQPFQASNPPLE